MFRYNSLVFLSLLIYFSSNAQFKIGDQPTSLQKSVAIDAQGSNSKQGIWVSRITDTTDATGIDGLNPPDGMIIFHTPSKKLMLRTNGYWYPLLTSTTTGLFNVNADDKTITGPDVNIEIGSAAGGTKDFNLSVVPGQNRITFNLPDAANDTRGVVTINTQKFAGLKSFNDGVNINTKALVNGNTSNASNLYLGVTSSTATSTTATKYLSVDNSGRVILVTNSSAGTARNFTASPFASGTMSYGSSVTLTFNMPTGTNFAQPATVVVTPKNALASGIKIEWATITDVNTISVSFSNAATNSSQSIATTDIFYFSVREF